jgi:hypothetical protein
LETEHLAAKLKNQLPPDGGPTMKRHTHISPDDTRRRGKTQEEEQHKKIARTKRTKLKEQFG